MPQKALHSTLLALSVTTLLFSHAAVAQTAEEAKALPTAPTTRAERNEARTERRAAVAEAVKKGEIAPGGEATPSKPRAVNGSKEARRAERAQKRKEVAAANKAGQLPQMGEAGEPKK